jgi:hypothetical protein
VGARDAADPAPDLRVADYVIAKQEPVQISDCDGRHGNFFPTADNGKRLYRLIIFQNGSNLMIKMPDGIVTVHLDGARYRGAYYYRGEELVVTAYGLKESSADMAVLDGERGKAALNLAKLVLIDMVRDAIDVHRLPPGLSLQGSTTAICLTGSARVGF